MGLFRAADGRARLLWRLLGFLGIATFVAFFVGAVTPRGLVGGAAALLAGSLVAGWWALGWDDRGLGALGFHLSGEAFPEGVKGLALGVGVGGTVVGLMALTGGVRWTTDDGDAVQWLVGGAGALALLAIPAAAEEAFLRGYPLQAIGEAWGAAKALVMTSVVFGALHLANPGATWLGTANVAVAGLLLGVVYLRTLSLWWATGAHLGWNWAIGYLADVPVSGLDVLDAPLYDGVTAEPEWLGGGSFGPEASVVSTVVLLGASALCWWGPWLEPGRAALAARPLLAGRHDWNDGYERRGVE